MPKRHYDNVQTSLEYQMQVDKKLKEEMEELRFSTDRMRSLPDLPLKVSNALRTLNETLERYLDAETNYSATLTNLKIDVAKLCEMTTKILLLEGAKLKREKSMRIQDKIRLIKHVETVRDHINMIGAYEMTEQISSSMAQLQDNIGQYGDVINQAKISLQRTEERDQSFELYCA